MLFNQEQVMQYLPHRSPFLYIDKIDSINVEETAFYQAHPQAKKFLLPTDLIGGTVQASYFIPADLPIFAGHFPGHPIFPGVLQVETMAQGSAFLFTKMKEDQTIGSYSIDVALLGIDRARFKKPIYPEMQLVIKSKLIKCRQMIMLFAATLEVEQEVYSQCEFMASIKFK